MHTFFYRAIRISPGSISKETALRADTGYLKWIPPLGGILLLQSRPRGNSWKPL